jgi:hypothetical protein
MQELITAVQALAYRIRVLLEARAAPQSDAMVRALRADVRAWREGVQRIFSTLSEDPASESFADLRSRLDAVLTRLESRVDEALDGADATPLPPEESRNMYRLLGAHRGVSEAVVELSRQSGGMNWARLREARF